MKTININELINWLSTLRYETYDIKTIESKINQMSKEIDNQEKFEEEIKRYVKENGDEKSSPKD